MRFWKIGGYFGVASVLVGAVFGFGFTHPFSSRVRASDQKRVEQLGKLKPFSLDPISGWVVLHTDGSRPTVVLVHGRSANRMEWFPVAERIFRAGYNVVLWDLRGHGNSGGRLSYGKHEIPDILGVIDLVRQEPNVDSERIALIGFSMGAAFSIGASAFDEGCWISGVIADSPYASLRETAIWYMRVFGWLPSFVVWPVATVTIELAQWISHTNIDRLSPRDWAPSVRSPVLLIHGEKDRRIDSRSSQQIYERIPTRKELWPVPDSGHTGAFEKDPTGYMEKILSFLSTLKRSECRSIS